MAMVIRTNLASFRATRRWLLLGVLFLSLAVMQGCATTQGAPVVPSDHSQGGGGKIGDPPSGTTPSSVVTKDSAIAMVEKQPDVEAYKRDVESAGFKFFIKVTETKSRFVVRVGEEHPDKVTVTAWYVVSKADGQVKKWDLTQGSPLDE